MEMIAAGGQGAEYVWIVFALVGVTFVGMIVAAVILFLRRRK
jgi:LPXTG-motif cell wall-anchored protein